jgi:hypothetical protein
MKQFIKAAWWIIKTFTVIMLLVILLPRVLEWSSFFEENSIGQGILFLLLFLVSLGMVLEYSIGKLRKVQN